QEGWANACDPNGWGNANWDPQKGVNGPSQVIIDSFAVVQTGTITYQLTPNNTPGSPGSPGDYPQVFANQATLAKGSTFAAWFLPGIYADQTVYKGVLVANNLTGTFSNVIDNSLFLNPELVFNPSNPQYPGQNVDLVVTRTPFNEISGES